MANFGLLYQGRLLMCVENMHIKGILLFTSFLIVHVVRKTCFPISFHVPTKHRELLRPVLWHVFQEYSIRIKSKKRVHAGEKPT